jgi:hypothetical protein
MLHFNYLYTTPLLMAGIFRFLPILALVAAGGSVMTQRATPLPVVDLGYELHQAISLNVVTSPAHNYKWCD